MNREDIQKVIELVNESKIEESNELIKRYYPNGFVTGCATEFSIYEDKGIPVEELYWDKWGNLYKSSISNQTY